MYDHILVPTDGSRGIEQTVEEATGLAGLTGATIHGLYVIDTRDYSALPETKWVAVEDELRAEGERALTSIETAARDRGVDVVTAIERGIPHEEIRQYASDNEIDLVVMGTHGRSGINRFLLGSVTENVVRSADVPVLVIRIGDEIESEE